MKKIVFILISTLLFPILIFSQNNKKIPITSKSKNAIELYKKGFELEDKLKKDEAEVLYKKAIELDSDFALAYLRLAMLRDNFDVRRNYIAEAMKYLDKITEGEKLWILARNEFYGTGRGAKEYEYFENLLKLYPNDEKANFFYGFVNFHHGGNDYSKAIKHLKKSIEINPDYATPYDYLAHAYMDVRDFSNSEKVLQKYIKLVPDSPDPFYSYAEMLMRSGRFTEAVKMYDKTLEINPEYAWAIIGKAASLNFLEKHPEARKVLPKLDEIKLTDYEDRHRWRAKMGSFVDEGNIAAGIEVLRNQNKYALDKKDTHQIFFSHLRLVRLLLENEKPEEALEEYGRWLKYFQTEMPIKAVEERIAKLSKYYQAYAGYLNDEFDAAKQFLSEYETENGSATDESKILKAQILLKEKSFDEALKVAETTDLKNAYNQYVLGKIYEAKGENKNAKEWFKKAATKNTLNDLDFALIRKKAIENLQNTQKKTLKK